MKSCILCTKDLLDCGAVSKEILEKPHQVRGGFQLSCTGQDSLESTNSTNTLNNEKEPANFLLAIKWTKGDLKGTLYIPVSTFGLEVSIQKTK